ncbi:MAG: hypothetical protein NT085_04385 [candidate division SR1 bacterium]|nr:hypothetical protein [candidate division SR1 bacterium]
MVETLEKESAKTVKDVSEVAEYTPASPIVEQKDSVADDPASLYDDADALSTKIESVEQKKIMDEKVKWLNNDIYSCEEHLQYGFSDAPFYLSGGTIKARIDWKIDPDMMENTKYTWTEENVAYMNKLYKETKKELNFSEKNYKIDVGKSKERKLANGWKEIEMTANIDGSDVRTKILYKKMNAGMVGEYQDDGKIPKNLVGEQLFDRSAICYLGLDKKLPNKNQMSDLMKGKSANYTSLAAVSSGIYNPETITIEDVGSKISTTWLSDGSFWDLVDGQRYSYFGDPKACLSVRLLK